MNASEQIAAMYDEHSVAPDEERPRLLREARGRDDADTWPCPPGCDCLVCEPPAGVRVGNVFETEHAVNGHPR